MPGKTQGKFIQAAGGIVVRNGKPALFAVVQRAKDGKWVLPRGKLKRDESPLNAARREVTEETGHRVEVNEFIGAITYRASGRPKFVQFWQMQAEDEPSHQLMADIVAVDWLPLKQAIRRLSYQLEKLLLRNVGARAAKPHAGRKVPRKLKRPKLKPLEEKADTKAAKKKLKKKPKNKAKDRTKEKAKGKPEEKAKDKPKKNKPGKAKKPKNGKPKNKRKRK